MLRAKPLCTFYCLCLEVISRKPPWKAGFSKGAPRLSVVRHESCGKRYGFWPVGSPRLDPKLASMSNSVRISIEWSVCDAPAPVPILEQAPLELRPLIEDYIPETIRPISSRPFSPRRSSFRIIQDISSPGSNLTLPLSNPNS